MPHRTPQPHQTLQEPFRLRMAPAPGPASADLMPLRYPPIPFRPPRSAKSPPPRLPASWGGNYEWVGMVETGPGLALGAKNGPRRITGNYEIFLYGVALTVPVPLALLLAEFGPVSVLPVAWRTACAALCPVGPPPSLPLALCLAESVPTPVPKPCCWLNLYPFPGRCCAPSPG